MSLKHPITVKIRDDDEKVLQEVNIFVKKPGSSIISAADIYKAKVWNKCLSDGILTKMELHRLMEKRGIWDDDMEKKQEGLMKEISNLEKELYLGDKSKKKRKISEGKDIAVKIRKKRMELRDLIADRISMEENTAESLAENARFDYIVAECTFYENGEKVYEDVEDYKQRADDEVAFEAATELAKILFRVDKNFERNLPENKWLEQFHLIDEDLHMVNVDKKKVDINGILVDNEGNYINAEGHRIDKEGNLLNEDGTYVLSVEYEDDTVKPTRKKTVKAES